MDDISPIKKVNSSFNTYSKNNALYQSSRMLDLSNMSLNKMEESRAEDIRMRNIDRLKAL